jgi:riboflavin synthase
MERRETNSEYPVAAKSVNAWIFAFWRLPEASLAPRMFSGIVEETGLVESYDGHRLIVKANSVMVDLGVSESICVSGACLTVVELVAGGFAAETVPETVNRTSFSTLKAGDLVNLERSLTFGDRVGGHIVQGHVDAVGSVQSIEPEGNSYRISIDCPQSVLRYVVEKGFIAVDGISLTVTGVDKTGFSIAVIPYTREHTTLKHRAVGDPVNLEADVTAKYVERLMEPYLAQRKRPR